jgi:hypothetical protein
MNTAKHVFFFILLLSGISSFANSPKLLFQNKTYPSGADREPNSVMYLRNIAYGDHERNVMDLWLVDSEKPAPLVLYIHGGGFQQGDKSSLGLRQLNAYLDAGFSVAAVNYRLTNTAPAPAAYYDCARALQFLRYHANKWNLDKELIASTGGSAGAGISMWLAFHDDLADPENSDPVARESTRLICVAMTNGQPSYDPRFAEKAGIPRPNFERHSFFLPFYDITMKEKDTPLAYHRYKAAAPVSYLSPDDPPVFLEYTFTNEKVTGKTTLSHIVHHPKLGIALKEKCDSLNIECIIQYQDNDGKMVRHEAGPDEEVISNVDFIKKHVNNTNR